MTEIKSFTEVPHGFHMCTNGDCPWKDTCLRQIAMRLLPDSEAFVPLVNPNLTAHPEGTADGDPACRFYRENRTVTYARGFIKMEKQMPLSVFHEFRSHMLSYFSRNPFYERRRGNLTMSPDEQSFVRQLIAHLGFSIDNPFDTTEERVDWGL